MTEKNIHFTFKISLILKGVYSFVEIVIGTLTIFATKTFIISTTLFFLRGELAEQPRDFLTNYFWTLANNISLSVKYFLAFYLLVHGIIKLLLIIGLMKKKFWAYPTSIIVFSLFILYELYRYFNTYSLWLLLLLILDLIVVTLTIYEYRYMKSKNMFIK
jgi:uncharacterized membrane protein